jgi:hypothetical protein
VRCGSEWLRSGRHSPARRWNGGTWLQPTPDVHLRPEQRLLDDDALNVGDADQAQPGFNVGLLEIERRCRRRAACERWRRRAGPRRLCRNMQSVLDCASLPTRMACRRFLLSTLWSERATTASNRHCRCLRPSFASGHACRDEASGRHRAGEGPGECSAEPFSRDTQTARSGR